MSWVKPVICLRSGSHLATRLELRAERAFNEQVMPWLACVYVLFAFVDWVSVPGSSLTHFLIFRLFAVTFSLTLWPLLRRRVRYGLRIFMVMAPYLFTVEYIMISSDLVMSPYFAGVAIVMVTATALFPVRLRVAAPIFAVSLLPLILYPLLSGRFGFAPALQQILMAVGCGVVSALDSGHVWTELRSKFIAEEALARERGRRGLLVEEKAGELARHKIFESQFSPQVVRALMADNDRFVRDTVRRQITNIVIDIQDSTKKAHTLPPTQYREVIEEVLDVFSAACLKWNVTLDKFIGDGVQAFSGAPIECADDLDRAISACRDTIAMLRAREATIERSWNEPLKVRFAVCRGEALIGFIGRGVFKSYTAIGEMISFTHRLSALPAPGTIAVYDWNQTRSRGILFPGFSSKVASFSNVKGFDDQAFVVTLLTPHLDEFVRLSDGGRCRSCETPLVSVEGTSGVSQGQSQSVCPACVSSARENSKVLYG